MTQVAVHSAQPTPVAVLLRPDHLWRTLWLHRDLIHQFSRRYFLARFRGTYLGTLWAFLLPLLSLGVYTFVFNFVFSARFAGGETRSQYAVALFCGITVYGIFSETVTRAASLVLDNPNLVKKVVFPTEILPVAALGSSLGFAAITLALVLAGVWVFYGAIPVTALLLPIVLLPLVMLGLGLAWFLASLGVFIRDVGNVVTVLVSQLLFFLTPIFYRPESLPEPWRAVSRMNPLTPIITGARSVLVEGQAPEWPALAASAVLGLVLMHLGYAWFMKSKRGFADVL